MEGVIWFEKLAETTSGFKGLLPAIGCQFDSVIGDGLVDIAIF
jgi:hypothetical protein